MDNEEIPKFKAELYSEPNNVKMCRILSMSGGGSKGAYEAGALNTIFNHFDGTTDAQYDVVSGVSVGAINSASMALFAKGDEKALGEFLLEMWMNLSNEQVWVWRDTYNPVEPFYYESGYVDDTPLFNLLLSIVTKFGNFAQRLVITTANDVLTGNQEMYVIRPGYDDV